MRLLYVGCCLALIMTGCRADSVAAPSSPAPSTSSSSPAVTHAARADGFSPEQLITSARAQIGVTLAYDSAYTSLAYPNGDVAQEKGVCTDVVIRAMRAQKIDLQQLVHEDMQRAFTKYPTRWGLRRPDANIDHRRVLNLETFMQRRGKAMAVTQNPTDYQAGDWVTWRVGDGKLPHVGIVSDRQSAEGTPLIIHNIGGGTQEEDVLFAFPIVGHFRW